MWNASGSGDSILLYKTCESLLCKGCYSLSQFWYSVVGGGQDPRFPWLSPHTACASFQVHEQTRDERPRALRSYDHHECRYFSLLPERRMVQISILPSIFFLLPIWVSFPLQSQLLAQCSREILSIGICSFQCWKGA